MAKAFNPSAEAERVLKAAHAAGLISTREVGKILLLAINGDVASFNQQMSALARKLEGARS